jgi:hypothetical protein
MVMSGKPGNGFPGEVRTLRLKPAVPVLAGDAETGVPRGWFMTVLKCDVGSAAWLEPTYL